jgi:flagellar assembly protein FliH
MSTSPSRALAPEYQEPSRDLQPFPYDPVLMGAQQRVLLEPAANAFELADRDAQLLAQGRREGQAEAGKAFEEQLAKQRASLAGALAQFTRDRAAYFEKVEGEIVGLSLAIARKILHREAQLDPLLLAGIVRVALEQIDGATGVVLRIHPQNTDDWQRYLRTHLDPADVPEIVADASQPPDQCTLETSMGTTTAGLEVQLKEIEKGLMDLLAARPGATP